MSGVNKLIQSNNQKNGGSQSALKSALVKGTVDVKEKTSVKKGKR